MKVIVRYNQNKGRYDLYLNGEWRGDYCSFYSAIRTSERIIS
jgi:hypothetical protein